MKISFLIHTIYGIGGTIRSTLNLANELADRHEVEIVSVFRHRDVPLFHADPRIALVGLVDTRPGAPEAGPDEGAHLEPSALMPRRESRYREYSALTDERIAAHYEASDADVVIATRPALVPCLARSAPQNAVLIGQEHMSLGYHGPELVAELLPQLDVLDALVTVSEADAAAWRGRLPQPDTRVLAVPNGVPEPGPAPAALTEKLIVAAGRTSRAKQYDTLLHAFARVVAAHPGWRLRIYGWGPDRERVRRIVHRLGLHNSVELMGSVVPMEAEWVKGSVAVSTSRHESFGLTLVEAMRCGLPVVSTDCDHGPRTIITDGEDGLLVPVGDSGAVAGALRRLIEDEPLRRRLGAAARISAARFDPAVTAKQYEELFAALGAGPLHRTRPDRTPVAAARPFAPVADCTTGDDGSLTVRIVAPAAAAMQYPGLRLVCTRTVGGTDGPAPGTGPAARGKTRAGGRKGARGGTRRGRTGTAPDRTEHVFPFDPDGTAVIPAGAALADGEWTCHTEDPRTGRRSGLTARTVDQRGLLRAAGRFARDAPVHHLVPFRDPDSHRLTLRSWVRRLHVESGDITADEHRLTLTGRIHGPDEPAGEPTLVLRRGDDPADEMVFHGTREGTRGFSVTLDCETVADRWEQDGPEGPEGEGPEEGVWHLWLRYHPEQDPVAVGRLLDDVLRKSDVRTYPDVLLHKQRSLLLARRVLRRIRGRDQRLVVLKLAFDDGNRLVLHVRDR
ncbi:glycosyltransferase family 4 protein [Streptomyces sp. NPDC094448]|uniref:glycosyltransferase family 4 protein n=1 Tax=Streptomyces sp. NPDC094448 TaxID=3366063 RepID=UPI0038056833